MLSLVGHAHCFVSLLGFKLTVSTGLCPQKNVLFGKLTVLEHVKFWSEMKGGKETSQELLDLIEACGLTMKTHSRASTLSGGQKRKLQLACMFVGGTTVCLMDEVTSGLVRALLVAVNFCIQAC